MIHSILKGDLRLFPKVSSVWFTIDTTAMVQLILLQAVRKRRTCFASTCSMQPDYAPFGYTGAVVLSNKLVYSSVRDKHHSMEAQKRKMLQDSLKLMKQSSDASC